MQLEINDSMWDEEIKSIESPGLAQEINKLLEEQKRAIHQINRYLAQPPESSFYKSVPGLIEDQMARINNFCKQKFLTLAHSGDKKTLKLIQEEFLNKYKELLSELNTGSIKLPTEEEKPNHLYPQLQEIDTQLSFKTLLETIATKNHHYDPKCSLFISYAWATDENKKEEGWIQPFLQGLRDHLKSAGIPVILDIDDNFLGNNIIKFTQHIEESHYVALIGTRSLLDKYTRGIHIVCGELNKIKEKREKDYEKGTVNVLPILLSGKMNESFPNEYERYTTIRDWRTKSYLYNLKQLIARLYGIGAENEEYNQLWRTFAEEMKDDHPEWVHDILKRPYQQKPSLIPSRAVPDSLNHFVPLKQPKLNKQSVESTPFIQERVARQQEKIHASLLQLTHAHTLTRLYLYADPLYEDIQQEEKRVAEFEAIEAENKGLLRQIHSVSSVSQHLLVTHLTEQHQLIQIGLRGTLALLLYKQRRYGESTQELNGFINELENEAHIELFPLKLKLSLITNAYNLLAKISRSTGLYAEAIQYYDKALSLSPEDSILLSSKGALLNDFGKYLSDDSQHIQAMAYHRRAEKLIHRTVESSSRKSVVLTNLGRGLQLLVEAKIINPDCFFITLKEAEKVLTQAIELNPDNLTAHLFRGIIYMDPAFSEPSLVELAVADFNYILAKQPEHPTALIRKARLLMLQKQFQSAAELLDEADHYLKCREWIPEKEIWLKAIEQSRDILKKEGYIDSPGKAPIDRFYHEIESSSQGSHLFIFWSKDSKASQQDQAVITNDEDEKEKIEKSY